jgi:phosphatidylinositol alpha-1,6-mannosyltransferase
MALALKWWCGIRYICYVHGEEANYATTSRELTFLAQRVLASAEFVIVNSCNTGRLLQEEWGFPHSRLRLLHPGVDTAQFLPASHDPYVRARLGWGERPVILTVGRLQRRKGHDQLIRALGAIRGAVPNVLYAIAGDGEERAALEGLVIETGQRDHVQFLGELQDDKLVQCYQQCDLFVLPNRQVGKDIEGFGMVLLEAQASGKPVVAGTSGGTAETMCTGETGYVISCEGSEELAGLVIELLTDRRQRTQMGQAARQWIVEHFDWSALAEHASRIFAGRVPIDGFIPRNGALDPSLRSESPKAPDPAREAVPVAGG